MRYSCKILLSISILLLYLTTTPQEYQYFNNRYDLNGFNESDQCYNILQVADCYVTAGNSMVISGNIYWWEIILAKIDFEGQSQSVKHIGEDSIDYFFNPFPGFMINDDENFYAVGVRRSPTSNWYHDEGILFYLDENLDTLWSRRYGEKTEPYDTVYWFTCIQKINTNELIIAGLWKPYSLPTHVYLVKTDINGQLIWERSYSYNSYYIDAYSVAQTSDKGFILGCLKQMPGDSYSVDPLIIKADSLGNQVWSKNLGSQYKDNKAMVCISNDSMILIGTNYADSMLTPDISLSKINILKLDNLGNIFWNKKYGTSKPHNFLLSIRVLNDNCIVAVGTVRKYDPEPNRVGWILKISPDGDSLWYREYKYLSGQDSYNYLYDLIEISESGLLACGYIEPLEPDTGSTDTWVIRLDSIGCDSTGCDTTVGIKEQHGGMEAWEHGGLYLWPNPAKTIVNCQLSTVDFQFNSAYSIDDLSLVIYDIFGREIRRIKVAEGQDEVLVNVESYPQGVYIIILKNGLKLLESRKFVVTR
jgi:hypothetical protein